MLKKLKSALKSQKGSLWRLALKAIIFSVLLALANNYWLMAIVFILVAALFYLRPLLNIHQFLSSFFILLVFSFLVIKSLSHWSLVIVIFCGFLFFLLLGIKNLIFVNRQSLYYLFNGLLFLLVFIFFFNADKTHLFFIKYLLTFLTILLLFKEFLSFQTIDVLAASKRRLAALAMSFLTLQLVWAIALLPLNFLNATSLALLIVVILQDFLVHHFKGTINRQIILRNVTIFSILALMIFAASKWTL